MRKTVWGVGFIISMICLVITLSFCTSTLEGIPKCIVSDQLSAIFLMTSIVTLGLLCNDTFRATH